MMQTVCCNTTNFILWPWSGSQLSHRRLLHAAVLHLADYGVLSLAAAKDLDYRN